MVILLFYTGVDGVVRSAQYASSVCTVFLYINVLGKPLNRRIDGLYRIDVNAQWKMLKHHTGADHAAIIIYRGLYFNTVYRYTYLKQKLEAAFSAVCRESRLTSGHPPYYSLWLALGNIRKSTIYHMFTDEERDMCNSYIAEIMHQSGYGKEYKCTLFDVSLYTVYTN